MAEAPLAALVPTGAALARGASACASCVLRGAAAAEVLLAFDIGTHGPAGLACVRTHSPEPEYRVLPPPLVAQPEEVCAPAMPANAANAVAIATALRRCAGGGLSRFIIVVAVLSRSACKKFSGIVACGGGTASEVAPERQQLTCLNRTNGCAMNWCSATRSLHRMSHAYTVFGVVCAALLFGLAVTGCSEGPAEKAGRKIDRAVDHAGDAVRDATRK